MNNEKNCIFGDKCANKDCKYIIKPEFPTHVYQMWIEIWLHKIFDSHTLDYFTNINPMIVRAKGPSSQQKIKYYSLEFYLAKSVQKKSLSYIFYKYDVVQQSILQPFWC